MKTLTILRHAKSSWSDASLSDHDRPLNGRGKRDAPVMAERIRKAEIRPSLIVSSPAKRAWSTAKVIAREISYPIEFLQREKSLYHAGLQSLLDTLAQQDQGFNSILLVGHNPGLTDLANFFVPRLTDNIPTCGFVSVQVDREDWNFSTAGDARLIVYDYPKSVD
ncbi:MAG: phosphohistidine phosphatase [Woeseiaceae bacterium]|jgi:phosphohistidine phosphatase